MGYNISMENINLPEPSLTWLGHAGFSFIDKNGNNIYFIDPFQLKNFHLKPADIIFITHAHYDHFSPADIEKILKEDTVVVAPPDILEKIKISPGRKIPVKPNQKYDVKKFSFSTIPAYNNVSERLAFHPKANNWVGYIFELNGQKIYHAGDTDFTEEMKSLDKLGIDIALLPIGGTYTMDVKDAADAANAIRAKTTIPMHYKNLVGEGYKNIEEEFKRLVVNSKVVILEELK